MQVGVDEAQHVGGSGFQAVGFCVQRAGTHAHGLVVAVAPGIARHLLGRYLHVAFLHAQLWQHVLLHQLLKRLGQTGGGQVTEQADTGIGIQSLRAGRVDRLPVTVVIEHLLFVVDCIWKLQRQATWGVGGQIQQADVIEGTTL